MPRGGDRRGRARRPHGRVGAGPGHRHRLVVAGHRVPAVVEPGEGVVHLVVAVGAVLGRPDLTGARSMGEALEVAVAPVEDPSGVGVGRAGERVPGDAARRRSEEIRSSFPPREVRSWGVVPDAASPVATYIAPGVPGSGSSRHPLCRPEVVGMPLSSVVPRVAAVSSALSVHATTTTSRRRADDAVLAGVEAPVRPETRVERQVEQPALVADEEIGQAGADGQVAPGSARRQQRQHAVALGEQQRPARAAPPAPTG